MKSYDQKQLDAVLVTCLACRKSFYMTSPSDVCGECRHTARPRSHRRGTGKRYISTLDDGREKYEHRMIAEIVLGKPFPEKAEIHHVDENKKNNANRNLVICQDHSYHALLHVRARILSVGGDPNTQAICSNCKQLHPRSNFHVRRTDAGQSARVGTLTNTCKACAVETSSARRRKRTEKKRTFSEALA